MLVYYAEIVDTWPACPGVTRLAVRYPTYEAAKEAAERELAEAKESFLDGGVHLYARVIEAGLLGSLLHE